MEPMSLAPCPHRARNVRVPETRGPFCSEGMMSAGGSGGEGDGGAVPLYGGPPMPDGGGS